MAEEKRPMVRVNDAQVAEVIQEMLAASGIHVEKPVIMLIMRYQTNHYENVGAIKIIYDK